ELRTTGGLKLSTAGACTSPRVTVAPLDGGLRVQTAASGEFCLRWRNTPDDGDIALRFPGDVYHGAAELGTHFDRRRAQKLATTLRFEPRPLVIELDRDQVAISGILDLSSSTAHAPRGGHTVELLDERNTALAAGLSSGDGKVRLSLDPAKLDGPGHGLLRLRFAGDSTLEKAEDEQPITRRALVTLTLASPAEATDPGDAASLALELTTKRGAVDGGVVEALVDGASRATAPVAEGKATLEVPIPIEQQGTTQVSLRYLPASPFFQPGPVLEVAIPIAPPSMTLRALLAALVVAVGAWVTVSWRRSKKTPRLGAGDLLLTPGVHVVKSEAGTNAWSGVVVDAHDGHRLRGVTVLVRAPSLESDGVLVEVTSDAQGEFAFALERRPDGAELLAASDHYAEERRALPAGGTLRVALITRRRALVRRLVRWAKARGRPYDAAPEPTPAQVQQAAILRDREEVEVWAREVEAAAFGPSDVDAAVEERITELEPGPQ
ncbi:MAG: hypothetical protein KC731_33840, partial [Myxococcales bacterium]|nr:hypothetical protein [Myxococcales bacterium]